MSELRTRIKACLRDLLNGYATPVVLDNIQICLDEDEEDLSNTWIVIKKWHYYEWVMVKWFAMGDYMKDEFLNWEKMQQDIIDLIMEHHETPENKPGN